MAAGLRKESALECPSIIPDIWATTTRRFTSRSWLPVQMAPAVPFGGDVEVIADGSTIARIALPDSGTNHATALVTLVAEMLGYTSRDRVRVVWGDTDTAPSSGTWNG